MSWQLKVVKIRDDEEDLFMDGQTGCEGNTKSVPRYDARPSSRALVGMDNVCDAAGCGCPRGRAETAVVVEGGGLIFVTRDPTAARKTKTEPPRLYATTLVVGTCASWDGNVVVSVVVVR